MTPPTPAPTIALCASPRKSPAVSPSFFLHPFRRRMEVGVASVAMMSLVFYHVEADAANKTISPVITNNCSSPRSLSSEETVSVTAGAGTGKAVIVIRAINAIDGCTPSLSVGANTDLFNIDINGDKSFQACFALAGAGASFDPAWNGEWVFFSTPGAMYTRPDAGDPWRVVQIDVPLTFIDGTNTIRFNWTGGIGPVADEAYCIDSLTIEYPETTPPPCCHPTDIPEPQVTPAPPPEAPLGYGYKGDGIPYIPNSAAR